MRILFFGDGDWGTRSLVNLHEAGHEILGVIIRRHPTDPKLAETATVLNLPVWQPPKVNDSAFIAQIRKLSPDLNLSVSYDQILRRPILDSAIHGFINFHAGKLPHYRGRNVINWAIMNGEESIGLTGHYVDEGIDTGDIILQHEVPILWKDTYGDVLVKVTEALPHLVVETVRLLSTGQAQPQKQAHIPGTYYAKRGPGDEWLDWTNNSRDLYNKIRAITRPGPGARTLFNRELVVIWRASYDPTWPCYQATPGQIVGVKDTGVMVKTGDATLLIEEIQGDGEYPEEPNWRIGDRLGINIHEALYQMRQEIDALKSQDQ